MYGRPCHWALQSVVGCLAAGAAASGKSSMLQFRPTLRAKFVCGWIRGTAGRADGRGGTGFGFVLTCRHLATDQRVEILRRFDTIDLLEHHRRFGAHLSSDLLVILFRALAALVFAIKHMTLAENAPF